MVKGVNDPARTTQQFMVMTGLSSYLWCARARVSFCALCTKRIADLPKTRATVLGKWPGLVAEVSCVFCWCRCWIMFAGFSFFFLSVAQVASVAVLCIEAAVPYLGSSPLRLSFLFRNCDLWTLSCGFAPHKYWNSKMALIAGHLNYRSHAGGDSVAIGI